MDVPQILLSVLRSELTETEFSEELLSDLGDEAYASLYKLAKAQELAQFVGSCFSKINAPCPPSVLAAFSKRQMIAVWRCERLRDAFDRLCVLLEEGEIPFIPLKGAVIRPYYPAAWMRTSCDIDVLVHEEDVDRAISLISAAFGIEDAGERHYHDVSLFLDRDVHLELHFNIQENIPTMDAVLTRVWEYSHPVEGKVYHCVQTPEFLLFHQVAHAAYHFVKGGCGIRPFMDWWLLKRTLSYDAKVLEALLSEAALSDFAAAMDALSHVWFSGEAHTDVTLEMEAYLLGAGIYGSRDNALVVDREKKGGRIRYTLQRIFMPYRNLKSVYPTLARFPILYPFYTVKRWIDGVLRGKGKRALKDLKRSARPVSEREARIAGMCRELGLIEK